MEQLLNNATLLWDGLHASEDLAKKVSEKAPGYKHPEQWKLTAAHHEIIGKKTDMYERDRRDTWAAGISFLVMCDVATTPRKPWLVVDNVSGVQYTTLSKKVCVDWLYSHIRFGWDTINPFLNRNCTPLECENVMVIPLNSDHLAEFEALPCREYGTGVTMPTVDVQ